MNSIESRTLFGVTIRQRTENGMLNLSDLQEAYTHARVLNNWKERRVEDILLEDWTVERIYYLISEDNFVKSQDYDFMKDLDAFKEYIKQKSITKVLKEMGLYKTAGARENKTRWVNEYIWILIAMDLNPKLYAMAIKWLTDKLIFNRIEACEMNKSLRGAMTKLPSPNYAEVNMALNKKIFGKHETGIRNTGSEKQLHDLYSLEDNIAFCINKGFYKTNEEVIEAIKTA